MNLPVLDGLLNAHGWFCRVSPNWLLNVNFLRGCMVDVDVGFDNIYLAILLGNGFMFSKFHLALAQV